MENQAVILHTFSLHMLCVINISINWKKKTIVGGGTHLERMDKQDFSDDVTLQQRPNQYMSLAAQHVEQ